MNRRIAAVLFLISFSSFDVFAAENLKSHIKAEVVSDRSSVQPGERFYAGIHFKMDPDWHIYWRNAGDSGIPTVIDWKLPEGVRAGPLLWPFPKKIQMEEITSYGYDDEIILLNEMTISENFSSHQLTLEADVTWLGCEKICVPGKSSPSLTLPVSSSASEPSENNEKIQNTLTSLPEPFLEPLKGKVSGSNVTLELPEEWGTKKEILFYPYEDNWLDHGAPQKISKVETGWVLKTKKSSIAPAFSDSTIKPGIIAINEGEKVYEVEIDFIQSKNEDASLLGHLTFKPSGTLLLAIGALGFFFFCNKIRGK